MVDYLDRTPHPYASPTPMQRSAYAYESPRNTSRIKNISLPNNLSVPQIAFPWGEIDQSLNSAVEAARNARRVEEENQSDVLIDDVSGFEEAMASQNFDDDEEEPKIINPTRRDWINNLSLLEDDLEDEMPEELSD
jgi:hypothetical protein